MPKESGEVLFVQRPLGESLLMVIANTLFNAGFLNTC
jgi:hypothetical protein